MDQKTNSGDIKSIDTKVSAEQVGKVTINEVPIWVIVALVVGWILPSPNEIARWIANLFKRKKNGEERPQIGESRSLGLQSTEENPGSL